MRVDFYQLGRDGPESVVPLLARATMQAGQRLVVAAQDDGLRGRLDQALWEAHPESFLAHGDASDVHAARQPILLAKDGATTNKAEFLLIADGSWRDEALGFKRVFFVFDDEKLDGARACWRMLDEVENAERHFWKQEGGKWREGP